jgi:hypothetical protein
MQAHSTSDAYRTVVGGCRVAVLLLASAVALAHVWLSAEIVDGAMADLRKFTERAGTAADRGERAAAWYEVATTASELTDLMNEEVAGHGTEQQRLLDEAVARAGEIGVRITWSAEHRRYFYLGDAYARYLSAAPDGINAADSRYQLIEVDFYHGDVGDFDMLVRRADDKRDFLQRYPAFGDAGRVAMFLAVDYRDLWRQCRERGDETCAKRYAARLREHLASAADRYAEDRTGPLLQEFSRRFEIEAGLSPQ